MKRHSPLNLVAVSQIAQEDRKLDVIFLHGLGGSADTWRATDTDSFWPRWLAEDVGTAQVWLLEYDAVKFWFEGQTLGLPDRAVSVLNYLVANGIGQRDLVLIAHSLGGLIVKQMLYISHTGGDGHLLQIAASTRAVVFLATPHAGSKVAILAQRLGFASKATSSLQTDDPWLLNLNTWYRNNAPSLGWETRVFSETHAFPGIGLIVSRGSADPGVSGVTTIPDDSNHLTIAKLESRNSAVYRTVEKLIATCLSSRRRGGSREWSVPGSRQGVPVVAPPLFFGRTEQQALLFAALASAGRAAILVLGPAGVGKTSLTSEVGASPQLVDRFGDRRWFVAAKVARDAAALRSSIIKAVTDTPFATSYQEFVAWLGDKPSLLILDNFETPWEQDPSAVAEVVQALSALQELSLVISFRGSGPLTGVRWTHPPILLEPLSDADSKRLFLELAYAIKNNDPYLDKLIEALGGLPLAIELVAKNVAGATSLLETWELWQAAGSELQDPELGATLVKSLALSWQSPRLHEEGRSLFRLMGQLPAGVADEDRIALFGRVKGAEAKRQLMTVGLAVSTDDRLQLLPPIRDYAARQQPILPTDDVEWRKHYILLARNLGKQIWGANGVTALKRLSLEQANIETALRGLSSATSRAEALEAVDSIYRLWSSTGVGSLTVIAELAELSAVSGDADGEAAWRLCYAYVAFDRAELDAARSSYERAKRIFQSLGDHLGEGLCSLGLGDISMSAYELDAARTVYEVELPIERRHSPITVVQDNILSDLQFEAHLPLDAEAAFVGATHLFASAGSSLGLANAIQRLGDLALDRSDYDGARRAFMTASIWYEQSGSAIGISSCRRALGDVELALAKLSNAYSAYEAARTLCREIGSDLGEANCTLRLGQIAKVRGQSEKAAKCYEIALRTFRASRSAIGMASCLYELAELAQVEGRFVEAQTAYEQAAVHFRKSRSTRGEANCAKRLGVLSNQSVQSVPFESRLTASGGCLKRSCRDIYAEESAGPLPGIDG